MLRHEEIGLPESDLLEELGVVASVQYVRELADTDILVNAACPGFVATDLNGFRGTRTVEQGAAAPIRLATLPDGGPTGGFFEDAGPIPW